MLKEGCYRLLRLFFGLLPREKMTPLLARLFRDYALAMPPVEALRFLFDIDARLYEVEGETAVRYGGGVHTKHRHTRYHDFFVSRLAPGERVLDVGCGCGAVAYTMAAEAGARVVAVDIDSSSIDVARRFHAHPGIEYLAGDALKLNITGPFDAVVLSNVLEHLPGRVGFLQTSVAVFKPKRFLIRVPLYERDWRVPLRQEVGSEWRLDSTHETEYTLESFREEMEAAGLEIVCLEVRWGEIWSELCPVRSRKNL